MDNVAGKVVAAVKLFARAVWTVVRWVARLVLECVVGFFGTDENETMADQRESEWWEDHGMYE